MQIVDPIYGSVEIREPVLVGLINSKPVQRLKGISQAGPPAELFHESVYSRFEHSVGVMLLLQRLGAGIEEQMAGLLHDVSHTVFSHVIDLVQDSAVQEDFQDRMHEKYLKNSDVPLILAKHGFGLSDIQPIEKFSLLEKPLPDLCADRVDYALREFKISLNLGITPLCLQNLCAHQGSIAFKDCAIARQFAVAFLRLQTNRWGAAETAVRYQLLATVLKIALAEKSLTKNDFYSEDAIVLSKLKKSKNPQIQQALKILSQKKLALVASPNNPQFVAKKKFRYVDPLFLQNGGLTRLSDYDSKWKKEIGEARKENERGIRVSLAK